MRPGKDLAAPPPPTLYTGDSESQQEFGGVGGAGSRLTFANTLGIMSGMSKAIGGPFDGSDVTWSELHVCVPLADGTYATYHKQPWDECVFQYDGQYHFGKIVSADELQKVTS